MNLKKDNKNILQKLFGKYYFTLFIIVIILLLLNSCHQTKKEDVYKIKLGMTYEQVEEIMPFMEVTEYNAPNDYRYAFNYISESGQTKTFWIIIRNGKVVNFYSL
jgi:outer membrane lipoprotein-sorting protein